MRKAPRARRMTKPILDNGHELAYCSRDVSLCEVLLLMRDRAHARRESLRHCLNAAVKRVSACCGSENSSVGAAKPDFFIWVFRPGIGLEQLESKLLGKMCQVFAASHSGFTAEPVIGPAKGRTRWRRPGMTPKGCAHPSVGGAASLELTRPAGCGGPLISRGAGWRVRTPPRP
jgi:hypothetical protein